MICKSISHHKVKSIYRYKNILLISFQNHIVYPIKGLSKSRKTKHKELFYKHFCFTIEIINTMNSHFQEETILKQLFFRK